MKKINCILLIDDNEADNVYHKIIIEDANICNHVKMAKSGIEGLNYITKSGEEAQSATDDLKSKTEGVEKYPKADLIFLDINMPGMNGFDFLEEYKKLEEKLKSKAVIIMLTTSLNPDDRQKALSYKEVKEFMNKPLTVESLHKVVEKYSGMQEPV